VEEDENLEEFFLGLNEKEVGVRGWNWSVEGLLTF
jgi:hypothetical protein